MSVTTCKGCNKEFNKIPTNKIYCTVECRKSCGGISSSYLGIPPGTVGAIAELAVSNHLLSSGFEVYRALSPSSSCDILALKNKKTFLIEVRSGYQDKFGKVIYGKQNFRADIMAVYVHSLGKTIFFPEI